jgi:hypothetical protein
MSFLSNLLKIGGAGLGVAAIPFTGGASGALLPALLGGIGAAAGGVGNVLGSAGQGQAAERAGQNNFQQNANRDALSSYGTQQSALLQALLAGDRGAMDRANLQQGATTNAMQGRQSATTNALSQQSAEGLARAQLGLQAPSVRAKQSVLGSLMKNLQDVDIQGPASQRGHVPTITGGMRPSNLDPQTRAHGEELMKAAMAAQLSGSDIPAATDFKSGIQDWDKSVLEAPAATDYSKGILAPPKLAGYEEPGKLETGLSAGGTIASILAALQAAQQQRKRNPMDEVPAFGLGAPNTGTWSGTPT